MLKARLKTRRPGKLVVLEGPDGSGKSSRRDDLANFFKGAGFEVVLSREPGGTPFAEKIRELCKLPLDGEPKHADTELLLNYASRVQHLREVVIPALERGAIVLLDRFTQSSLVYQVLVGKANFPVWQVLEDQLIDVREDLLFILDVDVDVAAARRRQDSSKPDHFDDKPLEYREAVNKSYRELEYLSHSRVKAIHIDANISPDQVFAQMLPHLQELVNAARPRPAAEEKPGFRFTLRGVEYATETAEDKFRVSVVYQDGHVEDVAFVNHDTGVVLSLDQYATYCASHLQSTVSDVVDVLSTRQRDGVSHLLVEQFPFDVDSRTIEVSVEKELKI